MIPVWFICSKTVCTDLYSSKLPRYVKKPLGSCLKVCLNLKKAIPLQAWIGPEGSRKLSFSDFMTTAQDGCKVVILTHRPPLPPGNAPGTHFCYRLSRPQGHSAIGRILRQWKIPMTPAGIEPAAFRFVAQHLNHCATADRIETVGRKWLSKPETYIGCSAL